MTVWVGCILHQGPHGVVLCNAFGYDELCTHRAWAQLAEQLAAQRIPTLRFDYPGTGDSLGVEEDPARVDAWLDSIGTAPGYLHRRLLQALDPALADPGDDRSDAWLDQQKPTHTVLTPTTSYLVYPVVARRGALPEGGLAVDVLSYCFRHEPSLDPARMQMFRMREYVRIGSPSEVLAFRQMWIERGRALARMLRLPAEVDLANDPFFGRGGKIVADSQRVQELKFELLIPVADAQNKTACLSFNYHMDHFGAIWNLRCADGSIAHTACVGFGMERLTLALLQHHGFDVDAWPDDVRELLWGDMQRCVAVELGARA